MISLLLLALPAFAGDPTLAPEASPTSAPAAAPAPAPVAEAPPTPVAAPATSTAPVAPVAPVAPQAELVRLDPPTDPKLTVQLGLGTQRVPYSSFAPNGVRTTVALSGRYHLNRWLGIDVALVHARSGGNRQFYDDSIDYDYSDDEDYYYEDDDFAYQSVNTTLWTERLDLGIVLEVPATRWFHPYAKVAAVGAVNVARLDEDTSDPTNLNQLSKVGFDGGGYFGAGLAFPIPIKHQVRIVPSAEVGYSALTPVGLGELGSLADSGFTVRFAWGVAF